MGHALIVCSGAIALVTVAGVGLYWTTLRSPQSPVPVRSIEAARDTLEITLNEGGIVQFGNQQTLKSPSEGAVEDVRVQPGDRVTVGQVLMSLRNPVRQTALTTQQVKIQQQETQLQRNRQRVAEAQAQLAADKDELENFEQLASEGAIAASEVNSRADDVRQSQAAVRDARSDVVNAELALQELQLERQQIERELEDTLITSPLDGVVLDVPVRAGDGVELRTDLITVGDSTQEFVELKLSTLNAAEVRPHQEARVSIIGPDPEIYLGRVIALYPQAIVSEGSSTNSNEGGLPRVPTLVRLNQPSQILIPGSQVNVEIILQQRQDVVVLDVEAIQNRQSSPFVWRVDSAGKAYQHPVSFGLEALTQIEIVEGLKPGDRVIVPPLDRSLEEGDPVVIDNALPLDQPPDDTVPLSE